MTPDLKDPFAYLKRTRKNLDVEIEPDRTTPHGCDPFGHEDMTRERMETVLDGVLADIPTAIAEAVRFIYFTGAPRRRNVRIKSNNVSVEYWDGKSWWTKGLRDVVDEMIVFAVSELEHCLDWSERLPARTKEAFEEYILALEADNALRDGVKAQVVEVMIKPYPDGDDARAPDALEKK